MLNNWVSPLMNPPKTVPPRTKYVGKSDIVQRKPILLNESKQITLKMREIAMISFRNLLHVAHTCFNTGGFIKGDTQ